MIVACYHPLPLPACMLNFDLVSILFGTSIPTSFNILVKMLMRLQDIHRYSNSTTERSMCLIRVSVSEADVGLLQV